MVGKAHKRGRLKVSERSTERRSKRAKRGWPRARASFALAQHTLALQPAPRLAYCAAAAAQRLLAVRPAGAKHESQASSIFDPPVAATSILPYFLPLIESISLYIVY